jgi:phosphocarrier protein HPr
MVLRTVVVPNRLGIHARPAAQIVKLASTFQSEISLTVGNDQVNAKSIMGVMTLAAGAGTLISISASGSDEEKAVLAIAEIFCGGFGEEMA